MNRAARPAPRRKSTHPPVPERPPRPASDAGCVALIAVAFVFFAWRSWRTWPDLLIDFGNELYVPWRITEGEHLYRDIAFTMGPLSQYFHALLFRLFGVSL